MLKRLKHRKLKKNVKSVLNHPVRMGFLTVPLWIVGVVLVARQVRGRRALRAAPAY